MEIEVKTVYLSLGSNLNNRIENLESAISTIQSQIGIVTKVSAAYESESWGYESTNSYLNCCIEVKTKLTPSKLLECSQKIEKDMGRIKTKSYTDRIIDIDILYFDNLQIQQDNLTIPHPHISQRAFVLVPLNEIIPNLLDNKHFLTINQLLHNLESFQSIKLHQHLNITNKN